MPPTTKVSDRARGRTAAGRAAGLARSCHAVPRPGAKPGRRSEPTGTNDEEAQVAATPSAARNGSAKRPVTKPRHPNSEPGQTRRTDAAPSEQDDEGRAATARARRPPPRCPGRSVEAEDPDRGDLGRERPLARDEHERAVLAHRPGEGEHGPGEHGRQARLGKTMRAGPCASWRRARTAASSASASSSASTGWTARTENGSVTKASAQPHREAGAGQRRGAAGCSVRTGLNRSDRRRRSAARTGGRPATPTHPCPTNLSRTRTQAMAVPATVLTTTTTSPLKASA